MTKNINQTLIKLHLGFTKSKTLPFQSRRLRLISCSSQVIIYLWLLTIPTGLSTNAPFILYFEEEAMFFFFSCSCYLRGKTLMDAHFPLRGCSHVFYWSVSILALLCLLLWYLVTPVLSPCALLSSVLFNYICRLLAIY